MFPCSCRTWVKMVGKEDLVYVPIEKLHKLRSICGDHFNKKDFNKKGNRLKKKAVPKLHLFAQPLADELLREFPLHVASKTGILYFLTGCFLQTLYLLYKCN